MPASALTRNCVFAAAIGVSSRLLQRNVDLCIDVERLAVESPDADQLLLSRTSAVATCCASRSLLYPLRALAPPSDSSLPFFPLSCISGELMALTRLDCSGRAWAVGFAAHRVGAIIRSRTREKGARYVMSIDVTGLTLRAVTVSQRKDTALAYMVMQSTTRATAPPNGCVGPGSADRRRVERSNDRIRPCDQSSDKQKRSVWVAGQSCLDAIAAFDMGNVTVQCNVDNVRLVGPDAAELVRVAAQFVRRAAPEANITLNEISMETVRDDAKLYTALNALVHQQGDWLGCTYDYARHTARVAQKSVDKLRFS